MERILSELEKIKTRGLYRELRYFDAPQAPTTILENKKVLLLSSNNYLGLCNDERLKKAAVETIIEYGVGSGGSRLTTGSYKLHKLLEEKIADFKGTEASLVFNTGYMANLGTISGLIDKNWVVYCDRLNHASIVDGCRLSGAKFVVYKHCDMHDLQKKIRNNDGLPGLIVTDGVFSMDGDIAPLPDIIEIAKRHNLLTMVDDAHATGILGKNGAGTADYFGLKDKIDIQMGTLSKALASEGGYVAGKQVLIDYLRNRAKSFIYSTALAPQTIAVALKALEIVMEEPARRQILLENSQWLQEQLRVAGFEIIESNTPIIALIVGDPELTIEFSWKLFDEGIYIPGIRPPTVPKGTSRLRIALMATHTREELNFAVDKIKEVGKGLGIIN